MIAVCSVIVAGIAQTYLHLEQEKLKIVFDGRAVGYAQNAVNYVSRYVRKYSVINIYSRNTNSQAVCLCESLCS